jgi:hypothetical protein
VETGAVLGDATIDLADEDRRYKAPNEYDALVGQPTTDHATINGKDVTCTVIKRAHGGNSTELWVAEDTVPAFNQCAVKSIRDGKLELELIDFGHAAQ